MNSSRKDKLRTPDADPTQDQHRIQKSLGQDLDAGVLLKDASLPSGSMARTLSMTNDGTENNQPTWRYETLKGHARTLRDRLSEHVLAGHGPRVEMPQRVMGGAERHKAGDGRGRQKMAVTRGPSTQRENAVTSVPKTTRGKGRGVGTGCHASQPSSLHRTTTRDRARRPREHRDSLGTEAHVLDAGVLLKVPLVTARPTNSTQMMYMKGTMAIHP